jgi:hypothetical protein
MKFVEEKKPNAETQRAQRKKVFIAPKAARY